MAEPSAEEAPPEWHPHFLEGRLVKISGVQEELAPWPEAEDPSPGGAARPLVFDANGQTARVDSWSSEEAKCLVTTLDGVRLKVPAEKLRECEPPGAEEGGFDLMWPRDEGAQEMFAPTLVDILADKGYCVIQMWMGPRERERAIDETYDMTNWMLPKKEFEPAYMGLENSTKYAMLPDDYDVERPPEGALRSCDRALTQTALLLEPYADLLGISMWGRLNGMVRLPLSGQNEARQLRPRGLNDLDYDEGRVNGHLNFLERRKLLMFFMIDGAGGEFVLHPKEELGQPDVSIPVANNKLVVFRNDAMGYSYKPSGSSLAVQAWILSTPLVPSSSEEGVVELPTELVGRRAHVMSLMTRYPGDVFGPQQYWAMLAAGTDTQLKVPLSRFDVDMYYSKHKDEGFTYALHGAFGSDEAIMMFDNAVFRIPAEEAAVMSPGQRVVLEAGLETLLRAGYSRESVQGAECGVFLGDSGNDWPHLCGSVDPRKCMGQSNHITGSRLSFVLGLVGPCSTTDTACSSSLVAVNIAHAALRRASQNQLEPNVTSKVNTALAIGLGLLLSPRLYVLYCGATMLSPRGRCFTFDSSADGFARGEGCGCLLLRGSERDEEAQEMLACLVGSAVNQDGRSASMTAPHGPSQQQCILASMAELDLSAKDIAMAECHGTGTALGDPIEVSALRMVMQKRDTPLLNTSAKTNIGHLEASAGMAGVIKCILAVAGAGTPPNPHFQSLNPHLDVNGYPVYFTNEMTDYSTDASITGVSSFGFGGTNARGDIWGRCLGGPRATLELQTGSWLQRRRALYERVENFGSPGPHESDRLYLSGSWDAFSGLQEMVRKEEGKFTALALVGETRREHFRIVLNRDPSQTFHPAVGDANQYAEIEGPDSLGEGKTWVLNGKEDRVRDYTLYRITFSWGFSWEHGESMKVSWEPTNLVPTPESNAMVYRHQYSIVGTWTTWQFQEMVRSKEEQGLWSICMRIGLSGQEEFQFARDNDRRQVIHPATARARQTSVPVRGPDEAGAGKRWLLRGPVGEVVTIQLRILDGEITVTTASETKGVKTWKSTEDDDWSDYQIAGSWNHWACATMLPDKGSKGCYRHRFMMGPSGFEEFQIVVERDLSKRLYPHVEQAVVGEGILCGPDANGEGFHWAIRGEAGSEFDVLLDLNQTDRRWAVSWSEVMEEHGEVVYSTTPAAPES